jgi:hypothetical protein
MGATSVTGVGAGSAEGVTKGAPERQTLGVSHLIGPYIAKAGSATLSSGAASVVFPLTGSTSDFILLVSNQTDGTAVNGTLAISSNVCTLTLAGTGSDVVGYAVVKVANFGL